jgi:hypothetical protein
MLGMRCERPMSVCLHAAKKTTNKYPEARGRTFGLQLSLILIQKATQKMSCNMKSMEMMKPVKVCLGKPFFCEKSVLICEYVY